MLLDVIYYLSHSKSVKKNKLGVIVNNLTSNNDIFKVLYQTLFLNISVSQWRNIANHGSYRCAHDGKIEITYGDKNVVQQYLERTQLESVLVTLDTLLYMHKTVYTLLCIDNAEILAPIQKFKETEQDDCISQLVETSYAYGLSAFEIKPKDWTISATIRNFEPSQIDLKKYCSAIATILKGSKFNILIYNRSKVQYQIVFENRQAKILKYVI